MRFNTGQTNEKGKDCPHWWVSCSPILTPPGSSGLFPNVAPLIQGQDPLPSVHNQVPIMPGGKESYHPKNAESQSKLSRKVGVG